MTRQTTRTPSMRFGTVAVSMLIALLVGACQGGSGETAGPAGMARIQSLAEDAGARSEPLSVSSSAAQTDAIAGPNGKVRGAPDFDGDGNADLLWYNATTGQTSVWLMNGTTAKTATLVLTHPQWKVIATPDLNGDRKSDLLWYNATTGQTSTWLMNGTSVIDSAVLLADANWKVIATPDLNGDGKSDLLWYNAATGQTSAWLMSGNTATGTAVLPSDSNWNVIATPDLNGDGKSDLLWYNAATGQTSVGLMNGLQETTTAVLLAHPDWKIVSTPDLNGDGKADLLWYNATTGQTSVWLMDGVANLGQALLLTDSQWKVIDTPDLNGDGKADLLWFNAATGQTSTWLMNGTAVLQRKLLLTAPNWKVIAAPDLNGDKTSDLLWYNAATGQTSVWLMGDGVVPIEAKVLLKDANWTVSVTPAAAETFYQRVAVTVTKAGRGGGTVTGGGIVCGATCSASIVAGATVTLRATAAAGSTFAGFTGTGCGTGTVTPYQATNCVATFVLAPGPSVAAVSGTQLMVQERRLDGTLAPMQAWTMRGVVWAPASVSTNTWPKDLNNANVRRREFATWGAVDIPLMKNMNVNTVRLLIDPGFDAVLGPAGLALMDEFYLAGIKVVMTVDDAVNDLPRVQQAVSFYKNHPAILMWSLGSEWNIKQSDGYYFGKFSTMREAADATQKAAALIKTLDANHPVSTIYGIDFDVDRLPLTDMPSWVNTVCTSVDVWGLNVYRGDTFGNLFSAWKSITGKPMFISEFGTDAFNTTSQTLPPMGTVDEAMQAKWTLSLWNDILRHSSAANASNVAIGGSVFEWNDEFWKVADPPGMQQTDGFPLAGGHPDGFANEEYFGIVTIDRATRQIYDALKAAFDGAYVPPAQTVTFEARSAGGLLSRYGHAQFLRDNISFFNRGGGGDGGRGFNIAAFTPGSLKLVDARNFDTYITRGSGDAMNSLIAFISGLPDGTILLVAVGDEAGLNPDNSCAHLTGPWVETGIRFFEDLGSTSLRSYCFRDSWAMTAVKGQKSLGHDSLRPGDQEVSVSTTVTLQSP